MVFVSVGDITISPESLKRILYYYRLNESIRNKTRLLFLLNQSSMLNLIPLEIILYEMTEKEVYNKCLFHIKMIKRKFVFFIIYTGL